MKTRRLFRRWWWLVLPLALGLAWLSDHLLDRAVKFRLEEIGNEIVGPGYTFSIGRVNSRLLAGSIDVFDLTLIHDSLKLEELRQGDIRELLTFSAANVKLRQVSYWDLLFDGEVHLRALEVAQPTIGYQFRPGADEEVVEEVVEEEEIAQLPHRISVDTLLIRSAKGSTKDITGTRPAIQIGGMDLSAYALQLRSYNSGHLSYDIGGADIHAWQLSAELPPIYDLNVADLHVDHPSGKALIKGLRLDPRFTEQEYGAEVEHEQDLFKIKVDSLEFLGIDVGRFIAEQVLHMRRMQVRSPLAQVYRDKTIPDGPFNYKSLPVSGLRKVGISIRIDTVDMRNGKVEYHEKDVKGPEYGMVSFSDINGIMTGLNNSKDADTTSHLVVDATARIYESTPVQFNYKAAMATSHDAFILDAKLGSLPFKVFNRMTDDLLNVQATEGEIHSMHIKMQGNEWQSSGTLDLAYENLRIDLKPSSDKWQVKNLLGNALVRKSNMPDKKNYRQGVFVVDRRKDRAVFNFIWQAVKAGSVDTMAPGLLRGQMRNAVSQPNKKKT